MRAHVRVPCSTSNIGAGFDCVGMALDRWLVAEARLDAGAGAEPRLVRLGALAVLGDAPAGDDLLVRGFALACADAGRAMPPGLRPEDTSEIPVARGLGSSAAALVARALLDDALLGLGLGAARVAELGATEEGHPDNVAPMLFGGAVLGLPAGDGRWTFAPLPLHADVAAVVAIPEFHTSTKAMRGALPRELPGGTAVRAGDRSPALVRGRTTGDRALQAHALDYLLHVPFRRALIPGYDAVVAAATAAGAWGATLSGAGSSLIALAPRGRAPAVADAVRPGWRAAGLAAEVWVAPVATAAQVGG
ncbi:homoserine kinase [Roseisolibacter sp. H3M3-2]|uniref:homoserine kinase n=1 Tax=Roseisolibacter sp. H3M3-2 TaxID=3031323 RepID=UPI0023DB26C5|nr:homoserine kinase [Roseisolibacter sp. H3M3-2]MDF1503715.1 homoserine kinase [Roseisolibacter sp. H3M3-2]